MPRLPQQNFRIENKAGERWEFSCNATVTSDGIFSIKIPSEIVDICFRLLDNNKNSEIVKTPQGHRLRCPTLKECRQIIEKAAAQYMECEQEEKLVIVYRVETNVAYFKDQHGKIYPNGMHAFGNGKWYGNLHATNKSPVYEIGLSARVYKKITYKRGEMVNHEYEIYKAEDGTWAHALNSFTSIAGKSNSVKRYKEDYKEYEIPYTEDAAKFFYETMMAICKLADKIEKFFSPENINTMIENNKQLMIAQ